MMELYSLSRALKSDFTTDIYCLNTMCDQKYVNYAFFGFEQDQNILFKNVSQNVLIVAYFEKTKFLEFHTGN